MSNKIPNIAVVGATGLVGQAIVELLAASELPIAKLFLLASEKSVGKRLQFGKQYIAIKNVHTFDFNQVDIAFFTAGKAISAQYVPKAAACGTIVIDNTSQFRYDDDVPLIVPEVNPDALDEYRQRNIIANPNCSTIQMVVALKPIHDNFGIKRITVATYQSVSGAGRTGIATLAKQTANLLNGQDIETGSFPVQIAFNAIPHIDTMLENGYTREEMKMVRETQKILRDDNIQVQATCVRVPVFYGHSEAVTVETKIPVTAKEVAALLDKAPGIQIIHSVANEAEYPTAVTDAQQQHAVYVGRIRDDLFLPNAVSMWIVADNVLKGGALNAVQIFTKLYPTLFASP